MWTTTHTSHSRLFAWNEETSLNGPLRLETRCFFRQGWKLLTTIIQWSCGNALSAHLLFLSVHLHIPIKVHLDFSCSVRNDSLQPGSLGHPHQRQRKGKKNKIKSLFTGALLQHRAQCLSTTASPSPSPSASPWPPEPTTATAPFCKARMWLSRHLSPPRIQTDLASTRGTRQTQAPRIFSV